VLRLVAMREHALLALSELSHELTSSFDVFGLADLVLLNLMGQLGTSRSAMWLSPERDGTPPALVRWHGMGRQTARAIGSACSRPLVEHFQTTSAPLRTRDLAPITGEAAVELVQQADLDCFIGIPTRERVLGLLALGPRVGGDAYGPVELESLQIAVTMVGVTVQNLTVRSRLLENNRQLRLANEHLQEMDRLKSQFIQNVNHELRTPLATVIAYLDLMRMKDANPARQPGFIGVAMQEAQKLQGMIENLLAIATGTGQTIELDMKLGHVTGPLARYFEERQPGITGGLREFHYTWEPDVPPTRFDERRMLQILDALIDNAVKFTPEGTRIQLRVTSAHHDGHPWVEIGVEDDGPGIPKESLPGLFESFRQVDGSATRVAGGMGIGLTLAKRLAEAMGGRLTATSAIGTGSTFRLMLPGVDAPK
jgi:signal transduction histidine kinase